MGEYATRICDKQEVKIGTCNEMWNIRLDQIAEVEYKYQTDDMLWRIPMPDEDGTKPGDYPVGLIQGNIVPWQLSLDLDNIEKYPLIESSGMFQIWDMRMGLTVNVKCYHGLKLPESTASAQFFWNGKSDVLHLAFLNNSFNELLICVQCRMCRKVWSYSWNEIGHLIKSVWMRLRLFHQCNEYWFRLHPEAAGRPFSYRKDRPSCFYHRLSENRFVRITSDGPDDYSLEYNDTVEKRGIWVQVRNYLITRHLRGFEGRDMAERYTEEKE